MPPPNLGLWSWDINSHLCSGTVPLSGATQERWYKYFNCVCCNICWVIMRLPSSLPNDEILSLFVPFSVEFLWWSPFLLKKYRRLKRNVIHITFAICAQYYYTLSTFTAVCEKQKLLLFTTTHCDPCWLPCVGHPTNPTQCLAGYWRAFLQPRISWRDATRPQFCLALSVRTSGQSVNIRQRSLPSLQVKREAGKRNCWSLGSFYPPAFWSCISSPRRAAVKWVKNLKM